MKRTPLGEVFVFVVTDYVDSEIKAMTGKSAGFDFGLKTFLTCSDGTEIQSPLFFKQGLKEIKGANRSLSRKKKGSIAREKARKHLVRVHRKIANQRRDWFWKLAHKLTDKFDYLFFETLNLEGMVRLWGRKISDMAFREFLQICECVANKKAKTVSYIDKWFPSSKTCSCCGHRLEKLELNTRYWTCPECLTRHGRDSNASFNIERAGLQSLGLGDVRHSQGAIAVLPPNPTCFSRGSGSIINWQTTVI